MSIGDNIRNLRLEKKMTLEELAKHLNTTKQTINKYEKGIVTNIPYEKIIKMSNVFNVEPSAIMGWSKDKSSIVTKATQFAERQKKIDRLSDDELKQLDDFIDFLLSKHI